MNTKNELSGVPTNWFVGASYGGTDDQMPRFLSEGIWENGYDDKHLDVVRSMRTGVLHVGIRVMPIDLGALCRLPNYAEWVLVS